jgi:MoaA/NifB/PqqE/SkfB family radical SAM enzyme
MGMPDMPKTFCKAPFRSCVISTDGALLPCCEYMSNKSKDPVRRLDHQERPTFEEWWEQGLDPLRQTMLKGEVDPGCDFCISKEKNPGLGHHRKVMNARIGDDYEKIKNDYNAGKLDRPSIVELRIGNYCNLKCIMCGPYASSSLDAEYKMNKNNFDSLGIHSSAVNGDWYKHDHNKATVLDVVANAREINFGGGEPFISPWIIEILQAIDSKTPLQFNTNMTKINHKVIDALEKFNSVYIMASIDGVGKHNNYLRHGSDWSVVEDNFKVFQSMPNVRLHIGYILQHSSVYTLQNVVEFANTNSIKIWMSEVYDDSGYLGINSVLPEEVEQAKRQLDYCNHEQRKTVQCWLDSYHFDAKSHKKYKEYVKTLDSIRGTDFVKTFNPSWA